jgi:6-phosphogluconate dehydrogenase
MTEGYFDFGIIGLGTMGKSLLLNMTDHGIKVAGVGNDPVKLAAIKKEAGEDLFHGFDNDADFVKSIRTPRAILMLVPAGAPVDQVMARLEPYLEPGDHLIDGGNSFYKDTDRRVKEMEAKGLGFIGMGVSGGESGARHGPSMMPGGTQQHWERVKPILEAVAAKFDGAPCVALMGLGSAGHYVKTVHNGIEYGIMQLIAETYDFLKRGKGLNNGQISEIFGRWNKGDLQSFLVEITETVLAYKDDKTGGSLVDVISDKAKSKGTGKWTSQDAMDLGLPVPSIDAAVNAREISGYKPEREQAEKIYAAPGAKPELDEKTLESALFAATLLAYAQGLALIKVASDEYGYNTNLQEVAKVWRAGCIIRSKSLEPIRAAFARKQDLANLLLDAEFAKMLEPHVAALRTVVVESAKSGIPAPVYAASLAYFDSYRTGRLPANLIQAQRDLFGAHTYERLDSTGTFHTIWQPE